MKNLGNKQTIVIQNCEIENHKYDLVITLHTQKIEYIHTKRQTLKRTIISKQRHKTRKRFSKHGNAFSESEVSSLDELYKKEHTINKTYPIQDPVYFSDSVTTSISSKKGKNRIQRNKNKRNLNTKQYIYTIRINQSDILTNI